jgi:AcrR family transcriptional regulator
MAKLWARTLDEHRSLVRRRLVDAFVTLTRERPLDEVTIAAVAEHAELARSAVYNHVDHLHDLALWHTEDTVAAWLASLDDAPPDEPALDWIERLVRSSLEIFADDPVGGLDLSGHLDPSRRERLFRLLSPILTRIRERVARGVEDGELAGGSADELAGHVWAVVSGYRSTVSSGRVPPAEAADAAVRMLRRAMTPEG